ncbi:GNAT family N-acetyltransferase [Chthonobacter rhizosphaerae]|uniref:GNAT family N-acetyltransferase n=1 Tax=Chthonobacter rhizosphaerae TaxID=2735553 RepID=UPI0015EEBEEA
MILWYDPYPAVIDEARLGDVDDLADIHATAFHRGWHAAEVEALLVQSGVFTFVARRGVPFGSRRPVGFVMIRAAGDEAEVLTIAVTPRHRGKGLGRRLIDHALRRLYHDRIRSLFLEVDETNGPACRLYKAVGFKVVGSRPNYYAKGSAPPATALVMRADLT